MNQNSILLRRRNKAILPVGDGVLSSSQLATFDKNLEGLGYTLSESMLEAVSALDPATAADFHDELVAILKDLRGVQDYQPMYPNFPRQVMEASEAELYVNAMRHYLSAWISDIVDDTRRRFVWLPRFEKKTREPLEDKVKLTVIEPGTEEELRQIFTSVVSSKSSISETDRKELAWFVENRELVLPESIPNKEVLAVVGALMPENPALRSHIKTATDVLRLAVAMSGGDVSLAENTKFRGFARRERKALLSLLENCGHTTEDMLRWKGRWIRLGERLHPGEYRRAFPKAAESFDVLRRDVPFPTFNSRVENAIRSRDVDTAIDLLRNRPGELARRLDLLLRIRPSLQVVGDFGEVAHGISTPVLLQVSTHFGRRTERHDLRIFFPKGSLAKVQAIADTLPAIPPDLCEAVVRVCDGVLVDRFSKRVPLGRVYVDE